MAVPLMIGENRVLLHGMAQMTVMQFIRGYVVIFVFYMLLNMGFTGIKLLLRCMFC